MPFCISDNIDDMVALFRLFASDKKNEENFKLKKIWGYKDNAFGVCVMSVWQAWITFENC